MERLVVRRGGPLSRFAFLAFRGAEADLCKTALLQPEKILRGVVQPVRVVHPEAGEFSLPEEFEDELVGFPEDREELHAYGRKLVDIEEAPVVDLFRRDPPVSEAVCLDLKEVVEQVKGRAFPLLPVKDPQVLVEEGPNRLAPLV